MKLTLHYWLTELQSKDKESYLSFSGVESSSVSTEVDYTTTADPKLTPYKWNNMVNAEKDVSGTIEENKYWKLIIKI